MQLLEKKHIFTNHGSEAHNSVNERKTEKKEPTSTSNAHDNMKTGGQEN